MAQVLKKLKKNSSEEVWVAVTDYKGRDLIDIRVYYRSIDDLEMKPTKRGVSLALAKVPELLGALEKAGAQTPVGDILAKIEKSESESLYVAVKEFKGRKLVDVRIYFRPQAGSEFIPSQKGVTFKLDDKAEALGEVKEALRQAKTLLKPAPPS